MDMHRHLTFFAGNTPIYRVRLHQKRKHGFQYSIEHSVKIDFVYKHFIHLAFILVFQSRYRFHRKNADEHSGC